MMHEVPESVRGLACCKKHSLAACASNNLTRNDPFITLRRIDAIQQRHSKASLSQLWPAAAPANIAVWYHSANTCSHEALISMISSIAPLNTGSSRSSMLTLACWYTHEAFQRHHIMYPCLGISKPVIPGPSSPPMVHLALVRCYPTSSYQNWQSLLLQRCLQECCCR